MDRQDSFTASNQRAPGTPNFNGIDATLPPIGVFWDIENCQVPCGKSALAVCECIRDTYFKSRRELEFMCVCDTSKENKDVIQEIINAQVTVVHVNATSKNAADDKLRQLMRRFADNNYPPATIILISGDVNFAPDLSDLRHRKKFYVIVVHNGNPSEALLACAHEHVDFHDLVSALPRKPKTPSGKGIFEVTVKNLPYDRDAAQVKARLGRLSENCGGKVVSVAGTRATIRFTSQDAADRAKKRMDCEDVFGRKISVSFPSNGHDSNSGMNDCNAHNGKRGYGGGKSPMFGAADNGYKSDHGVRSQVVRKCQFPPPPPVPSGFVDSLMHSNNGSGGGGKIWGAGSGMKNDAMLPSYETWEGQRELSTTLHQQQQQSTDEYRVSGSDGDGRGGGSKRGAGWKSTDGWPTSRSAQDATFLKTMPDGTRRVRELSLGLDDENGSGQSNDVGDGWPAPIKNQGRQNQRWSATPGVNDYSSGRRSAGTVGQASVVGRPPSCSPHMFNHSPYQSAGGGVSGGGAFDGSAVILENGEPVELQITNLDQSIDAKELKQVLQVVFREHVMVLHVSVNLSPDGSLTAGIKVPSTQDAQYAISRLHRRRIGTKRIMIAVANSSGSQHPYFLRSEVVALLTDVPGNKLPLFKFRELFEKRYHRSIGVAELHKLHDVVAVQENVNGRTVVLSTDYRNTPSPACSDGSKEVQDILDMSRCGLHCPNDDDGKGWAEKEQTFMLPYIIISLKTLSANIHSLLQLHANSIPLNSLTTCYECEFGKLETVVEGGVPMEHLVTCVVGVRITRGPSGVKRLEWIEDRDTNEHSEMRNVSPPLANQLSLFCREIVDLLKNYPYCRLAFTKFIPAYHHHFGRQCRVADYGYTKLLDFLSALTHVVQILGDGSKLFLTLTHRMQVKRFTADLLRILKFQPSKMITMYEFPEVYAKCIGKPFEIMNYGVCDLADILPEIPEGTAVVTGSGSQMVIAIPQREQTPEEVYRTKQFTYDVVELMRHCPRYRMEFTKFIPAYHHNFGRQCRVADYGVTKLIELFEAIPDTVVIKNSDNDVEDKILQLSDHEKLKVFGEQIKSLMSAPGRHVLSLEKMLSIFIQINGYSLDPEDFGVMDVRELLDKISHIVKVIETSGGLVVTLVDQGPVSQISKGTLKLLFEQAEGKMNFGDFEKQFYLRNSIKFDASMLNDDLKEVVKLETFGQTQTICLHPLQLLVREIVLLLLEKGGRLLFSQFNFCYVAKFGKPCCPAQFGHSNLASLLQSLHDIFSLRGRGAKRTIVVDRERAGVYVNSRTAFSNATPSSSGQQPQTATSSAETTRQLELPHSYGARINRTDVDLMSGPITCRLPSPILHPSQVQLPEQELMRFDNSSPENADDTMTESSILGEAAAAFSNFGASDARDQMFMVHTPGAKSTSPFFPPPSLQLPQVPVTWIYDKSLPSPASIRTMAASPMLLSRAMDIPKMPQMHSYDDSSETEMNTPPCIREVIATSSPELTPTRDGSSRYRPRLAAQFSNPLVQANK